MTSAVERKWVDIGRFSLLMEYSEGIGERVAEVSQEFAGPKWHFMDTLWNTKEEAQAAAEAWARALEAGASPAQILGKALGRVARVLLEVEGPAAKGVLSVCVTGSGGEKVAVLVFAEGGSKKLQKDHFKGSLRWLDGLPG